jgi:sulfide:quinone oxidoreductase
MTVFPVVPDFAKYPEYGRDANLTFGEIGLAGHWMKYLLHHAFIYQAKMKPGCSIIPD